ncbi:1-deoxy-D-xylulose-5-phosphate synthase [Chlamydia trachomatis]|uniref:1-deoxy-D-xylulose-5-phosphate synthase n=1 Tax=Chlamydia trachomatis serovar D (strain ATCC VR-885 / DSM 19411 / UW-3/Cx) TaxID=272561 RepID=DXS_CHLTR|nr:1-deoxy-D-xylulose-5-phosphate synthase [Chlamydia trachomatis]NP_219838.1 1-deoxy-D-xylulose-5-phosphate synthase [Chlamydia trachomatis D/UW-3/CX]O84335.1 RecName: Full=1-deoxy-D-xylulose-5-phosphate synthase; AltName: Full=1-deoxyxylulose-5-phosphate synthase; Short=DXP synthase; Short=DXPS [Chlamydia trachomatis D/UW-3/CX]AAC67926.1 Transketolase [Chlamydia trachomatis D/UW-3/CX]ADH18945.1 1-deoxy-D-xylulose-5-phosphate synthase [Chlamydia trachomatis G/11222]ADI51007.1 1-deoxy-D-xylulo
MTYSLLPHIHSPQDLHALSLDKLPVLCDEIRNKIIESLSLTGGHLASNLGGVELTVALHYVFSSPDDQFIFDVGHQSYVHKLLTGRNTEAFSNIRHDNGLSGFTTPQESNHDIFFSGHAGNALSLALGLAKGSSNSSSHILPILGDAAFSCGLTLEALNNIPADLSKFIIVLNDNQMSISENVGNIPQGISHWMYPQKISKLSQKIHSWIQNLPSFLHKKKTLSHKVDIALKSLSHPLFEQFGLHYVGPIDGHNVKKLVQALQMIKDQPQPILFHVCTVKGNGLAEAERDPIRYHGVKAHFQNTSLKKTSGNVELQTPISFPQHAGNILCRLGKKYPQLQVVTPAMSLGSCLEDFRKQFPDRFTDVGIAEGHAVTFSAGIARSGTPVCCSIYSTFLHRAMDNVFHDVCMQELPVIFAIDRAGLAFHDGRSHHGIYDLGFLCSMPNMVICQPRNALVLERLFFSSLLWKSPCAIRYPNIPANEKASNSFFPFSPILPGEAEILCQGDDLLLIALGHMCNTALTVKEHLLDYGISTTVVDPIFIKPLDRKLLQSLLTHHSKVIILEEHSIHGGLGSEFLLFLNQHNIKADVLSLGVPDMFIPHGNPETILNLIGLTSDHITQRILSHFKFSTPIPIERFFKA